MPQLSMRPACSSNGNLWCCDVSYSSCSSDQSLIRNAVWTKHYHPSRLWVTVILFTLITAPVTEGIKCHTCFTSCSSTENCDCAVNVCESSVCYSRLLSYNGNANFGIHKGCIHDDSLSAAGAARNGSYCRVDPLNHTFDCFCTNEDFCNAKRLTDSDSQTMNGTECCLAEYDDEKPCERSCSGSYCLDDHFGSERGCGHGRSELLRLLRIDDVFAVPNQRVCAKLWFDDSKNILQHGCVCHGKQCNNASPETDKPKYGRSKIECNSCALTRDSQTGESYDSCTTMNRTCWGNYCFALFKSEHIIQFYDDENEEFGLPMRDDTYSLQLGCINTDSVSSVKTGCTREWSGAGDDARLTSAECVCNSPRCNVRELADQLPGKADMAANKTVAPSNGSIVANFQKMKSITISSASLEDGSTNSSDNNSEAVTTRTRIISNGGNRLTMPSISNGLSVSLLLLAFRLIRLNF